MMTPMRSEPVACWAPATRVGRWLPACALVLALSVVWLFAGERGYFYSHVLHDRNTAKNMALVRNLSAQHGFLFHSKRRRADGSVRYELYNRFPLGGFVLTKLAIAPFEGDFAAQLAAARALMLAFFCAAAVFAYLGLARLVGRGVALGATLLAFSSYHMLLYSDAVSNETSPDLFALMLVFHGMVLFEVEGTKRKRRRFWELVGRVVAALLLGWHVYGLLLPYLLFVAVREARAAGRGAGDGATMVGRVGAAAVGALRGRAVLLGALALLFGAGELGYNLAREHMALGGQRALAELPTVGSMFRRTGLREEAGERPWLAYPRWQLQRIGAASVPFALSGGADWDEFAWRASEPLLFWTGLVATFAALAGVAVWRGPRAPPAALALAGFGWTLLVPEHMMLPADQYETMFHVGVPLCLFAALLLLARRLWRPAPGVCAAAAAVIFAASTVALDLRQRDAGEAGVEHAQMAEFDAVAKMIRGRSVWVSTRTEAMDRFVKDRRLVDFYMAGSFVFYADRLAASDREAISALDFVLAFERYDIPELLTPEHRSVFLYRAGADAGAVLAAWREARREERRRLLALTPVARTEWDIYVVPAGGGPGGSGGEKAIRRRAELAYLKAPCTAADTKGFFQLRFTPVGGKAPWGRRMEFESRDFFFHWDGSIVDDKCLMHMPLPAWPVAAAYANQIHPTAGVPSWKAVFRLDVERLRNAFRALRGEPPVARGGFDVYLGRGDKDRNMLRYARVPCVPADMRRRFFLHLVPDAVSALPAASRRRGFANLDFDFGEHGALFDGACFAMLPLPDYDGARVYTGQLDADAGIPAWQVEFALNPAPASR